MERERDSEGERAGAAGKRMKNSGKGSKANVKTEVRKDRKSATGMNGSPKKGGHGGKFTWAGDGYSLAEIGIQKENVDAKDPNFEEAVEIVNTA